MEREDEAKSKLTASFLKSNSSNPEVAADQEQKEHMKNSKLLSGDKKSHKYVPKFAQNVSLGQKSQKRSLEGNLTKKNVTMAEKKKLEVNVSLSLKQKLREKANEEGVTIDDFIGELLAEGLALRAWEIIERKSMMRHNPPSYSSPRQGGHRQRNQNANAHQFSYGYKNNHQNNHNNRGNRYSNIMEDNANFIDYVRKQEKKTGKW